MNFRSGFPKATIKPGLNDGRACPREEAKARRPADPARQMAFTHPFGKEELIQQEGGLMRIIGGAGADLIKTPLSRHDAGEDSKGWREKR